MVNRSAGQASSKAPGGCKKAQREPHTPQEVTKLKRSTSSFGIRSVLGSQHSSDAVCHPPELGRTTPRGGPSSSHDFKAALEVRDPTLQQYQLSDEKRRFPSPDESLMDPITSQAVQPQLQTSPDFKENADPARDITTDAKRLSFGTDSQIRAVQTTEDEFTVIRQM